MLQAVIEAIHAENIKTVLSSFTGNTSADSIRSTMNRETYEIAYIKALELYQNNYIVLNGQLIQHDPKWKRKVR